MTSPERDPAVHLRANVAAYVAAMQAARRETILMANSAVGAMERVAASYIVAERAAVSYAAAAARANIAGAASARAAASAAAAGGAVGAVGPRPSSRAATEQKRQVEQAAADERARQAMLRRSAAEEARVGRDQAASAKALQRDMAASTAEANRVAAAAASSAAAASARAQRDTERANRAATRSASDLAAAEEAAAARRIAAIRSVGFAVGITSLLIIAGLAASAKAAISWESDWIGVTKTVHGSTEQMATIEKQLRDMAKTLPASHAEIAATAAAAGQLGVATPFIVNFTRTAIQLGVTTSMSAEEASTGLAKLMNIMGASGLQIGRYGSTLIALENAGAGTAKDLLNMSIRLAGAGRVAGLTADQVMSLAGAMTNVGIRSELGGSSMQRVLLKMFTAVDAGGPKLAAFAKYASMGFDGATLSAGQFAELFRTKPVEALKAVLAGLHAVQASGKGFTLALADMGIKTAQDVRTLSALAVSNEKVNRTLETGATAWQKNLALLDAAEKRFASTHSRMQVAKNEIHDTAISFGQVLLPAIGGAADSIGGIASALGGLPGPAREILVILGSAAGAVGLLGAAALIAVPKIVALRAALASMGSSGAAFVRTLGVIGIALAGVAAEHKGIGVLDDKLDKMFNRKGDGAAFRAAAVEFAQSGKLIGEAARLMGSDFGQLDKDMDTVLNPSKAGRLHGFLSKAMVAVAPFEALLNKAGEAVFHLDDALESGSKRVKFYDEQWTALAQSGGVEEVQKNLNAAAAQLRARGQSESDVQANLAKLFPKTTAAMTDQATAAKLGGDAMAGLADDANATADGLDATTVRLNAFNAALQATITGLFGVSDAHDEVTSKIAALQARFKQSAPDVNTLRGAITGEVEAAMAAGRAHDDYASKLDALRKSMRGGTVDVEALRSAVTDSVTSAMAGERAHDALEQQLHDLEHTATGSAAAVADLTSAINAAVTAAYAGESAVDAFDAKVADIKKRIAEGPGQGVAVNLSLTGSNDMARQAREDVKDLVARSAALYAEDVRAGNDPTGAFAARRAELAQTLRDIGFYTDDIAATLAKYDAIPAAVAEAAAKSGVAIAGLSRELDGMSDAAIKNRATIRDLIDAAAGDIKLQITADMSTDQIGAIVAREKAALQDRLTGLGFDPGQVSSRLAVLDQVPGAVASKRRELEADTKATTDNRAAIRDLITTTADMIAQDTKVGDSKATVAARVRTYTNQLRQDLGNLGVDIGNVDLSPLAGIGAAFQKAGDDARGALPSGEDVRKAVEDIAAAQAKYLATLKGTVSDEEFNAAVEREKTSLRGIADQFDATRSHADDYVQILDDAAGEINTQVTVSGVDEAQAKISGLSAGADALINKLKAGTYFKIQTDPADQAKFETDVSGWITKLRNGDVLRAPVKTELDQAGFLPGVDWVKKQIGNLADYVSGHPLETVVDGAGVKGSKLFNSLQWVYDNYDGLREYFRSNPLNMAITSGVVGNAPNDLSTGGGRVLTGGRTRAAGGPVSARTAYWVGEKGPEILQMGAQGGHIFDAERSARMAGGSPYTQALTNTNLHRAPAQPPAPVINVSGPDFDMAALVAAIGSRPVVINLDGREVARYLGRDANQRGRTARPG